MAHLLSASWMGFTQAFLSIVSVYALVRGLHYYYAAAANPLYDFWTKQPKVGIHDEWFSWIRAVLRSFKGTRQMALEGYAKYSKNSQTFVVPSADRGPLVVIPPSYLKTIYNLPESILAAHASQNETIQTDYTLHSKIVYNNFHLNVLRNQLTRNLGTLTEALVEELALGIERHWGVSEAWTEVEAWPSCMKIVSGASNRAFIGLPLCRDEALLEDLRRYAMAVFGGGTLLNMLPMRLRPIVGQLVKFRVLGIAKRCLKRCLPFIKDRLAHNKKKREDASYVWTPPNDGLQWTIDEAYKSGPDQLNATLIGYRFLFLNFVSMHSTSFTITNTILDIYSSPNAAAVVAGLREECHHVLAEHGGQWSKEAVAKLVRFDSALRESMRLSNFGILALPRRVVARDGIQLPDGTILPQGMQTIIPMEPIHRDESIYPGAATYNAFRFSEPGGLHSVLDSQSIHQAKASTADLHKPKSSVTLDEAFVSFGIGKHACPGRFFALYEMKLMLAHIVSHYDVQFLSERPEQFNLMWLKLPSEKVRISIRKRAVDGPAMSREMCG